MVWECPSGPEKGILAKRISEQGLCIDSLPLRIADSHHLGEVYWDSTQYFILSYQNDPFQLFMTSLSAQGVVGKTTVMPLETPVKQAPGMTFSNHGEACIAYTGWVNTINDIPVNTWRIKGAQFKQNSDIKENDPLGKSNKYTQLRIYQNRTTGLLHLTVFNHLEQGWGKGSIRKITICFFTSQGRKMLALSRPFDPSQKTNRIIIPKINLSTGVYLVQVDLGPRALKKKIVVY